MRRPATGTFSPCAIIVCTTNARRPTPSNRPSIGMILTGPAWTVRRAASSPRCASRSQASLVCLANLRTKVASAARLHYSERRDTRRMVAEGHESLRRTNAQEGDPGEIVADRELLKKFRECLSQEERQLAEWRSQGASWAEIATHLGGTPDARRLQLSRAVDRVASELGLEE